MTLNLEPTEIKASTVLYVTGIVFGFLGVLLIMMDLVVRQQHVQVDTLIELWEWNPSTQFGLGGIAQGLYFFLMGILVDRRGA